MDQSSENLYQFDEEFRDAIATVDEKGKRVWIHPKKPSGSYHHKRVFVSIALLLLLFAGPFIHYNDRPLIMLNFLERKFIFFGQMFLPQDLFLLALTLITFFVFIILFTVAFGRIWCGWMCPQTLFMEMVFRKIEYWIEGDANAQRKLNKAPWNAAKIVKKTGKQIIFFILSLLIAHLVMAYIVGIKGVAQIVSQSPAENIGGFIGLLAFTMIFYGVFAYFREQACVVVCPYGRLQGVLLTKDSILVAYDWLRGEPRKKLTKKRLETTKTEQKRGDCVDCKLCVHVCPTGIDIRNGTQLECINCTACIDACDEVMRKVNKPMGLIRYSSYNAINNGRQKKINLRTIGYSTVLTVLVTVLGYLVITRPDVEATMLKVPGTLYSTSEDGLISNVYNVEFVNKTFDDVFVEVKPESPKEISIALVGPPDIVVPGEGIIKRIFIVKLPKKKIKRTRTMVELGIYRDGKKIETVEARFIGPIKSPT